MLGDVEFDSRAVRLVVDPVHLRAAQFLFEHDLELVLSSLGERAPLRVGDLARRQVQQLEHLLLHERFDFVATSRRIVTVEALGDELGLLPLGVLRRPDVRRVHLVQQLDAQVEDHLRVGASAALGVVVVVIDAVAGRRDRAEVGVGHCSIDLGLLREVDVLTEENVQSFVTQLKNFVARV